jgi:UDP-N-acetylglucosamine pyrophosphorylase
MANIRENSGMIIKQHGRFTVTYYDTDGNQHQEHFRTQEEAESFCKRNNLGC